MSKVLQFGDLHLGMENFGYLDPKTGLHSRFLDYLNTLDQIVKIAIKEKVDLVLFSGDAYKNANPSPTAEKEFALRLNTLIKQGIEVFLLVGNHDMPASLNKANALDVFSALEITGLTVIRKPAIYKASKIPVQVLAIPWINPNFLLAKDSSSAENLTEKALNNIEDLFENLLREAKKSRLPTLALVHASIEGSIYPNEESTLLGKELVLPKNWFFREPILLTCAGHLHKLQVLTEKGSFPKEKISEFFKTSKNLSEKIILYTGSPDYIDFGEEGERKCVALIELEESSKNIKLLFLPLKTRPLKTIKITLDNNPTETVIKRLEKEKLEGIILKLKLIANSSQKRLFREIELKEIVKKCYFYAGISWEMIEEESKKIYNLEAKTDEELLKIYFQRKKLSVSKIESLISVYKSYFRNVS